MYVMVVAYPVAVLCVLLNNIFIVVNITYMLNVTFVKIYLGKTPMNRKCIHDKFKYILKSGNACYHAVQNVLFSSLLSKNTRDKVDRAKILPVDCVGVELGLSYSGSNRGWRNTAYQNQI